MANSPQHAELLMICPSRGRPQNVAELIDAWRDTTVGHAELLVAVDDDDPELEGYRALVSGPGLHLSVGSRLRVGGTLNCLAPWRAPEYFALGFLGDDHRPRTRGWDEVFVRQLRELGSGIVYGDDLYQRERLPTAVALTSDIVVALGYFVPPGMRHMYLDNFWLGLGQSLGRIRYLPEVVIEHMHPVAGKAAWDPGYREVNNSAVYERDRAILARWIQEQLGDAIRRIQEIALAPAGLRPPPGD